MSFEGPWEIVERQQNNEVIAHEAMWTVLTDADNRGGVYVLRIAEHGQTVMDEAAVKILIAPDMANALVAQFLDETRPYMEGLPI